MVGAGKSAIPGASAVLNKPLIPCCDQDEHGRCTSARLSSAFTRQSVQAVHRRLRLGSCESITTLKRLYGFRVNAELRHLSVGVTSP